MNLEYHSLPVTGHSFSLTAVDFVGACRVWVYIYAELIARGSVQIQPCHDVICFAAGFANAAKLS